MVFGRFAPRRMAVFRHSDGKLQSTMERAFMKFGKMFAARAGIIAAGIALSVAAAPAHAEEGTNLCGYMATVVVNLKDVQAGAQPVIGKMGLFYEISKNDTLRDEKCDKALSEIGSAIQGNAGLATLPKVSIPMVRKAWGTTNMPADNYTWERQRKEGTNPGDVVHREFCNHDISSDMAVGETFLFTCANGRVSGTKQ